MNRFTFIAAAWLLSAATPLWAITIQGQSWLLQPNTPNQPIPIYVSGGDAVAGFDLDLTIGDGGSAVGGLGGGPKIQAVDLVTGTIFASGTPRSANIPGPDYMYVNAGVILAGEGDSVPAGGVTVPELLATLTVDTTGFNTVGQSWDVSLDYGYPTPATNFTVIGGDKQYPTIINGTITIAPEPSTIILLVASMLGLLAYGAAKGFCRLSGM